MTKEVQSLLLISKSPLDSLYLLRRNLPGVKISDLVNRICTLYDMPEHDDIYEYQVLKDSISIDLKTILELCVREKCGKGITAYKRFDEVLSIPEGTTRKYLHEELEVTEDVFNKYCNYLQAHGELMDEWKKVIAENNDFLEKTANPKLLINHIESMINNTILDVNNGTARARPTEPELNKQNPSRSKKRRRRKRLSKKTILARYYAKKVLIFLIVTGIICALCILLKKMPYIELTILKS